MPKDPSDLGGNRIDQSQWGCLPHARCPTRLRDTELAWSAAAASTLMPWKMTFPLHLCSIISQRAHRLSSLSDVAHSMEASNGTQPDAISMNSAWNQCVVQLKTQARIHAPRTLLRGTTPCKQGRAHDSHGEAQPAFPDPLRTSTATGNSQQRQLNQPHNTSTAPLQANYSDMSHYCIHIMSCC